MKKAKESKKQAKKNERIIKVLQKERERGRMHYEDEEGRHELRQHGEV